MVTNPTAGNIYLVESTAGVEDWITDHGGDPDLMDLALMTEGTHYCKLPIPKRIQASAYTGAVVTDSGGGNSWAIRWNRRGYSIPFVGWETTRSNAWLIDKFIMSDRHTAGAIATYKDYYLVIYFGINDHWKFTDASSTQQSYCKGMIHPGHYLVWDESDAEIMKFNGVFKSIW
jgi:hypothetical protein